MVPHLKIESTDILANQLIYYTSGGAREQGLAILRGNSKQYTMLNGVTILVNNNDIKGVQHESITGMAFVIDVNGYNNPPNKFGRDAFFMYINTENKIYLAYADDGEAGTVNRTRDQLLNGPSRYNYQCNRTGRGMWCGALIQADGWKIRKDYPW